MLRLSKQIVKFSNDDLLEKINTDSDGIFDWKVITGVTDSELVIVDNNKPSIQETMEQKEDAFDNMFMFKVMSDGAIIKEYDMDFKLPTGNIGNMYAVSAMTEQNKILPFIQSI